MGKISRDKRDIFYRLAKEQGWRARSAFKLIQIDEQFDILKENNKLVDLCAAPGGWTQVMKQKQKQTINDDSGAIVAVDLQAMSQIEDVHLIQGDISNKSTADQIVAFFKGELADAVVCDGAPDVIGLSEQDEYIQAQLVLSALWISTRILKNGGMFLAKMFRGRHMQVLYRQLQMMFDSVRIVKPRCSRNSSRESFVLCCGFRVDDREMSRIDFANYLWNEVEHFYQNPTKQHEPIEFVACGPLNGLDADRNYPLQVDEEGRFEYRAPIQMPIRPPYEKANLLRKNNEL